jgi:hypothetical protein
MAAVATSAAMATTASAAPLRHHDRPDHATAAVELLSGSNEQFATVNANAPGYHKGFVDYTNFSVASPSRVWSLNTGASEELTVWASGNQYNHTLNAGEILAAVSNNEVKFTGTGFYNPVPSDNWSVAGDIRGNHVTLNITYGSWAIPAYSANLSGRIAYDGSAHGYFRDSNNTRGTWSLPAGTFRTVLNYKAQISTDRIDRRHHAADLTFTIPFGNPYSGVVVEWAFANNHGVKTWAQGVNGGALSSETVESGVIDID